MPKMTLSAANQECPEPLLSRIKAAIAPFSGALQALDKAIADAATEPTQIADVHVDEVENWAKLGWKAVKS
jgi:hypothetical protein